MITTYPTTLYLLRYDVQPQILETNQHKINSYYMSELQRKKVPTSICLRNILHCDILWCGALAKANHISHLFVSHWILMMLWQGTTDFQEGPLFIVKGLHNYSNLPPGDSRVFRASTTSHEQYTHPLDRAEVSDPLTSYRFLYIWVVHSLYEPLRIPSSLTCSSICTIIDSSKVFPLTSWWKYRQRWSDWPSIWRCWLQLHAYYGRVRETNALL